MHFLVYPDGRKFRLAIWPHATAGGVVVVGDDNLLRFIEDEPPPCVRPIFAESVAGCGYTDAQKQALIEIQQREVAAWDAAHPEYAAWAARQPRVVHQHLDIPAPHRA